MGQLDDKRKRKLFFDSGNGVLAGMGPTEGTSLEDLRKLITFAPGAQTTRVVMYVATLKQFYTLDGEFEIGFKEQLREDMMNSDLFEGGRVVACWFEGEPVPEEARKLGYK